jgi:Fic family protein
MYTRITNLSESDLALGNAELAALAKVWKERKSELERSGEHQEFLKKLRREWSIETGIIERLYVWDRGVTEVLIEQGIDTSLIAYKSGLGYEEAEHIKAIIDDQLKAIDALFMFVKGEQPLTEHFIRAMHAQFTTHQESTDAQTPDGQRIRIKLLRGEYKKLPNNPRRQDGSIHEYCPPEIVKEEMERLVSWYGDAENNTQPEVLSAWLHHRFTQIHPFQDGNGRVARALATLVFLKAGMFPLVIRDRDRAQYISALETADAGDLTNLVQIFAKRQSESILTAIGLEQQVRQSRYAEEIIDSAIKVLKDRFAGETERLRQVYKIADHLHKIANDRFNEIAALLNKQLAEVSSQGPVAYRAWVQHADNNSKERHYFYHQIIEIAKHFNYFANLDKHRSWLRLSIVTDEQFEFVVTFHGYGYGDSGIMVATAFTYQKVPREEGYGTDAINTRPASPDFFQFNYKEPKESIERRFHEWFEAAVAIALAEWKRLIQA